MAIVLDTLRVAIATITHEARNALLIDRCARRQSTWRKWASTAAGCLGDGGDYTKQIKSTCLWRRSPVVRSRCRLSVVRSRCRLPVVRCRSRAALALAAPPPQRAALARSQLGRRRLGGGLGDSAAEGGADCLTGASCAAAAALWLAFVAAASVAAAAISRLSTPPSHPPKTLATLR